MKTPLCISLSVLVVIVIASSTAVGNGGVQKRDGSTIIVSTTAFNPALTNQGGTTNAAGTFNVSPLATSTSYQFQTLRQTSTFQVGPANTQAPSSSVSGSRGNIGANGDGGDGGSLGGGTVVVTATAPTSTVDMVGGGASTGATEAASAVVTASNGLPSLALGSQTTNAAAPAAALAQNLAGKLSIATALTTIVFATLCATLII